MLVKDRSENLYQTSSALAQLLPRDALSFALDAKDNEDDILKSLQNTLIRLKTDMKFHGELSLVDPASRLLTSTDPAYQLGELSPYQPTKFEHYTYNFDLNGGQSQMWALLEIEPGLPRLLLKSQESRLFFQLANLALHYFVMLSAILFLALTWHYFSNRETQALLAQTKARLDKLLETSTLRWAFLNAKGQIVRANPTFLMSLNLDEQQLTKLQVFVPNEVLSFVPLEVGREEIQNKFAQGKNQRFKAKIISHGQDIGTQQIAIVSDDQGGFILQMNSIQKSDALSPGSETPEFYDPATGLPNYAFFKSYAETHWDQLKQKKASLVLVDLDDFKKLQKEHGSEATEKLLLEFGKFLRKFFRQSDIVCRFKEDQYLVLLPEAPITVAERLANNLLATAKSSNQDRALFSIGVSALEDEDHLQDWISRSYAALKNAKLFGKGRVEVQRSTDLELVQ